MKTLTPTDLLTQIGQIQLMERGKFSAYHFKDENAVGSHLNC